MGPQDARPASSTPVLVDLRGGRLPWRDVAVALEGGPEVRFLRVGRHRPPVHLLACVDRSILGLDRLRRAPQRQLAWFVETPAERWAQRLASQAHRFRRFLTCDSRLLALGEPFERFHFGTSWVAACSEPKTRVVSMVSSLRAKLEGHRFRLQALERARLRGVECFGKGHRPVASKHEALAAYAFSVAVENCRQDEYFTEKLIDCFLCETVPIYWGFPSLGSVFDPRGVLAFTSLDELDAHLASLSLERYAALRPQVLENKRRVLALGLDGPGFWRRAAGVMVREAAGLEPAREPWPGRWRLMRALRAPWA
ncbi:MAG: glycosyltransferase family 10 domain-containing protein [Planctomycetia bacterium]